MVERRKTVNWNRIQKNCEADPLKFALAKQFPLRTRSIFESNFKIWDLLHFAVSSRTSVLWYKICTNVRWICQIFPQKFSGALESTLPEIRHPTPLQNEVSLLMCDAHQTMNLMILSDIAVYYQVLQASDRLYRIVIRFANQMVTIWMPNCYYLIVSSERSSSKQKRFTQVFAKTAQICFQICFQIYFQICL